MKTLVFRLLLLAGVLCLLAGCAATEGMPASFHWVTASAASIDKAQSSTPTVEVPLLPLSNGKALTAREVFAQVAPAVVFVETPHASGSAVLVQPGYLLTNAHVVWPYNSVHVTMPDGTEADVPVVAWDLVADLALLSAPKSALTPLPLVDGSKLSIGSDLFLIGYPGEVQHDPQPTIGQGILSRVRTWVTEQLTLFQVDADVTGGQSGGVLVTAQGEIVGITTFSFTGAHYALATSAADIAPRLAKLLNNRSEAFNDRHPLASPGQSEYTETLDSPLVTHYYLLDAEPGSKVDLQVKGIGQPYFLVFDVDGNLLQGSKEARDHSQGATITAQKYEGPYMVWVAQRSQNENSYTLTSSQPLVFYPDPDDGTQLQMGQSQMANIDLPGDQDFYTIELKKGEKVAIDVESLRVDPTIKLYYSSSALDEVVEDDNSGGGLFGSNAQVVYTAPADSTYHLIVEDSGGTNVGGYFVSVRGAGPQEAVTKASASKSYYLSRHGMLQEYQSERYGFTMKLPALWQSADCGEKVTACYKDSKGSQLAITETNLDDLALYLPEKTLGAYVDMIRDLTLSNQPDSKFVSRTLFTTPQGFAGEVMVFQTQAGLQTINNFTYVDRSGIAFVAAYTVPSKKLADSDTVASIRDSFSSFRIWDEDHSKELDKNPVHFLDEGVKLASQQEYTAAVDALTQALTLKPTLKDAYLERAVVFRAMRNDSSAAADLEAVLKLDPQDVLAYRDLASSYWNMGKTQEGLAIADSAIKLNADDGALYNMRALIRLSAGDSTGAIQDMEECAKLMGGELAPYALDTRAYINLKREAYNQAAADYDTVMAEDFRPSYTLLGAGVTYARLGQMQKASLLIQEGMAQLPKADLDHPDPQLADLIGWARSVMEMASSGGR